MTTRNLTKNPTKTIDTKNVGLHDYIGSDSLRRTKRIKDKKPHKAIKRKSIDNEDKALSKRRKLNRGKVTPDWNGEYLSNNEEVAISVLISLSRVVKIKEEKKSENSQLKQYLLNLINKEDERPNIPATSPVANPSIKQESQQFTLQPPKFPNLSSNWVNTLIDPCLTFNQTQMVFKRCETHKAIAYYTFYLHKYNRLKYLHENNINVDLSEINMNPSIHAQNITNKNAPTNLSSSFSPSYTYTSRNIFQRR